MNDFKNLALSSLTPTHLADLIFVVTRCYIDTKSDTLAVLPKVVVLYLVDGVSLTRDA